MPLLHSPDKVKIKPVTITSKRPHDHSLLTSCPISSPPVFPFIRLQSHWLSWSSSRRLGKFLPQALAWFLLYWESLTSRTSTRVAPQHPCFYTQSITWRNKSVPGHPSYNCNLPYPQISYAFSLTFAILSLLFNAIRYIFYIISMFIAYFQSSSILVSWEEGFLSVLTIVYLCHLEHHLSRNRQ